MDNLYQSNPIAGKLWELYMDIFAKQTQPTATNLSLFCLSMLLLNACPTVESAYKHCIRFLSPKKLKVLYYTLGQSEILRDRWWRWFVQQAVQLIPKELSQVPILISVDDTNISKYGKFFDFSGRIYDHSSKAQNKYIHGHCFVTLILSIPVFASDGGYKYLSFPLIHRLWRGNKTDPKAAAKEQQAAKLAKKLAEEVSQLTGEKVENVSIPKKEENEETKLSESDIRKNEQDIINTTGEQQVDILARKIFNKITKIAEESAEDELTPTKHINKEVKLYKQEIENNESNIMEQNIDILAQKILNKINQLIEKSVGYAQESFSSTNTDNQSQKQETKGNEQDTLNTIEEKRDNISETKLTIARDYISATIGELRKAGVTAKVCILCDSWYPKGPMLSLMKLSNVAMICAARYDTFMAKLPEIKEKKGPGRPLKYGPAVYISDFNLISIPKTKFSVGTMPIMTRLFDTPVLAFVTQKTTGKGKRRLYLCSDPSLSSEFIVGLQFKDCATKFVNANRELLPLALYTNRWEIEKCFYQLKTFWGMCDYRLLSVDGIETLLNLQLVNYSLLSLLPEMDKKFFSLGSLSLQERRHTLGRFINRLVIIQQLCNGRLNDEKIPLQEAFRQLILKEELSA